MRVELRKPVTKRVRVTKEVKPGLRADKCDACGKVFGMEPYGPADQPARMTGIFDMSVLGRDGRGLGNMFSATVCSFACAETMFINGGWKKLKEYKPYARASAELTSVKLMMTTLVTDEAGLIEQWENDE